MTDKKSSEKKNTVIPDERHNAKGAKKLGFKDDEIKLNKDGGTVESK